MRSYAIAFLLSCVAQTAIAAANNNAAGLSLDGSHSSTQTTTSDNPAPTRIGMMRTAFLTPQRHVSWTTDNLVMQRLTLGVTDNVQLNGNILLPVGVLGAMPELKIGGSFGDYVHVSGTVAAGLFKPLISFGTSGLYFMAGGEAALSLGTLDYNVNIISRAYGLAATATPRSNGTSYLAQPALGASVRLTSFLRAGVEVGPVFCGDNLLRFRPELNRGPGEMWLIQYGVQLHGEHLFADVTFIVPIIGGWTQINEYVPMGAPLLSAGYRF
jgi:hypothetical protein